MWCPSASLMTLARSVALQGRAPEPCLRRAPGALSYAMEGGSPWAGAGPEGPASRGAGPDDVFFFLGVVSGSLLLPRSGFSSDAARKARSREHTASFSSQGIVMTPPLPGILITL